jgi:hypothetical protein
MRKVTYSFEISDEAWQLLLSLNGKNRYAEYRDPEYASLSEFKDSEEFNNGRRTEEWFLDRNHGGTYGLIMELNIHKLVDNDYDAWHQTYVISELGKTVIGQNQ